ICGAYHYSYALTPADAIIEAQFCKRIIAEAGVLLELPVFFDMEDDDGYKARHRFHFTRRNITDICAAFLDAIKPLNCGVYASLSWLEKNPFLFGGGFFCLRLVCRAVFIGDFKVS
ncbi:MAG: hypothetical protein IKN16_06080, partial [Selenomonadaceae bacterium]|nr:hypothetical protein [Selenomonadaceae bacterium]